MRFRLNRRKVEPRAIRSRAAINGLMQIDTLCDHYARNPTVNNDRLASLIHGTQARRVKRNQQ